MYCKLHQNLESKFNKRMSLSGQSFKRDTVKIIKTRFGELVLRTRAEEKFMKLPKRLKIHETGIVWELSVTGQNY